MKFYCFILAQAQNIPFFIGLHDQYNIGVFVWDQPEGKTLTVIFKKLSIKTIKFFSLTILNIQIGRQDNPILAMQITDVL